MVRRTSDELEVARMINLAAQIGAPVIGQKPSYRINSQFRAWGLWNQGNLIGLPYAPTRTFGRRKKWACYYTSFAGTVADVPIVSGLECAST
jgi:hypothetical protein